MTPLTPTEPFKVNNIEVQIEGYTINVTFPQIYRTRDTDEIEGCTYKLVKYLQQEGFLRYFKTYNCKCSIK